MQLNSVKTCNKLYEYQNAKTMFVLALRNWVYVFTADLIFDTLYHDIELPDIRVFKIPG